MSAVGDICWQCLAHTTGQVVNIPHGLKLLALVRRFQSQTRVKLCREMDKLHIYKSSSHLPLQPRLLRGCGLGAEFISEQSGFHDADGA